MPINLELINIHNRRLQGRCADGAGKDLGTEPSTGGRGPGRRGHVAKGAQRDTQGGRGGARGRGW